MENQTNPPSLLELQLWMRWIVTDPRGVKDALAEPYPSTRVAIERYTSPPKTALAWIAEAPPIPKIARLDIYAEAYFSRVLESMKSDFQITARILGDLSFQKLVSDYIKQFPSRTTNIGEVGRNFSKFVAGYEDLNNVTFLEALTHMEWLFIESFYAENSGVLEVSDLRSLSDEDWDRAEFKIADSVRLIRSIWPLDNFSELKDESVDLESVPLDPSIPPRSFLFFREPTGVSVEPLSSAQYMILQKLQSGASLIKALEETQNEFSTVDIGSQIMNWFNDWVRRGIISDIQFKKNEGIL